ncbi:GntR family transcriptional regulator [Massilia norwichensis]|jgi:GntR family transcriptional regulator|uniref:GntR family transcriptional regulator n=1 Tax=Massilia norwichensis TaxID=1442366 RepID=A0ABT2AE04_9BURK|nr:GntR family transcriptional regulator [Massilia norwichensis]MCS0592345.1 GntR family transcriptional regulator [Massilia norwichensis]
MDQVFRSDVALGMPLYREVKHKIMEALRDGEWKPGEPVPAEKRLCERFGVSVGTLRKAVDELTAENILIRHQGRGTFVASHSQDRYMFGFFHICPKTGQKEYPKVEFIRLSREKVDADGAKRLGVARGAKVVRILNRLGLGGRAVIVDEIFLPERFFAGMSEEQVRERRTTLYQLYQDEFDVAVLRTEERLDAVGASADVAALLGIAEDTPLLHIVRRAMTFRDEVVELRHSYVLTDNHEYFAHEESTLRTPGE